MHRQLGNQRGGGRPTPVREYLQWVGNAEYVLYPLFRVPDVVGGLHTSRYGELLHLGEAYYGPTPIVYQEIQAQYARLTEVKQQLDGLLALASRPGDEILVYDTNSLMHYQPPNRIKWSGVVSPPALIRVVVPLCVIYELDQKAHSGTEKMAGRARAAVKALREITDGVKAGQQVQLVQPDSRTSLGATLEVLLEEPGHQRLPQVDDEIIDRALLLKGITDKPVRVITHDMNMDMRTDAAELETVELPGKYSKDRSNGE